MTPLAILIVWLIRNNILSEFLFSQLNTPLQITRSYSLPFPSITDLIPKNLEPSSLFHSYETYVLYCLLSIYLVFFVFLFKSWKKTWKDHPEPILLAIIGILTAPYMFGRTDLGHIVKASIPVFIIGPFVIDKLLKKKIFLLIPVSLIFVGIMQALWSNSFYNTSIQTKNGSIRLNENWPKGSVLISASTVNKAVEFIEKNSVQGDQIFTAPYMAGLYFITNRPSTSYVGNVFYTYIPDEEKFVKDLSSKVSPKVVIYDPENGPNNEGGIKQMKSYYPLLDRYILENFETVYGSPEGWLFMVSK